MLGITLGGVVWNLIYSVGRPVSIDNILFLFFLYCGQLQVYWGGVKIQVMAIARCCESFFPDTPVMTYLLI